MEEKNIEKNTVGGRRITNSTHQNVIQFLIPSAIIVHKELLLNAASRLKRFIKLKIIPQFDFALNVFFLHICIHSWNLQINLLYPESWNWRTGYFFVSISVAHLGNYVLRTPSFRFRHHRNAWHIYIIKECNHKHFGSVLCFTVLFELWFWTALPAITWQNWTLTTGKRMYKEKKKKFQMWIEFSPLFSSSLIACLRKIYYPSITVLF